MCGDWMEITELMLRCKPLSAGAAEVIVAVIDSGIDPNHPDLIDAIWDSDEVPDNGIDDNNIQTPPHQYDSRCRMNTAWNRNNCCRC